MNRSREIEEIQVLWPHGCSARTICVQTVTLAFLAVLPIESPGPHPAASVFSSVTWGCGDH